MRHGALLALKLIGLFVLGGLALAAAMYLVSFVVPMRPDDLRIGMGVTVAAFAVMGIVSSLRFRD